MGTADAQVKLTGMAWGDETEDSAHAGRGGGGGGLEARSYGRDVLFLKQVKHLSRLFSKSA